MKRIVLIVAIASVFTSCGNSKRDCYCLIVGWANNGAGMDLMDMYQMSWVAFGNGKQQLG